jgi:hypothetical protein
MSTEIVPSESQQALMPLIGPDMALRAWQTYQELCKKLLDEADYANIKGKMAKKRSGFTKLARFYGVSVVPDSLEMWHEGDDWGFDVVMEASVGERRVTGDGSCSFAEMKGGGIAATRHNIRAKASTRAFNRAVANILGTGEVSAEELDTADHALAPTQAQRPVIRISKPDAENSHEPATQPAKPSAQKFSEYLKGEGAVQRFWQWAQTLGMGAEEVELALGVNDLVKAQGTVAEVKKIIQDFASPATVEAVPA